jgi:catechol 2,3-dioxygenase-like lactoylglutathione lyase family enzyme
LSTTDAGSNDASAITNVDMKIAVAVIPVADADRAKEFYRRLGWRLDVTPPNMVQLTPRGSGCSIQFGPNLTSAAPGSATDYLIVSDITAALDKLAAAGIAASEVYHLTTTGGRVSGLHPEHSSYRSWATFHDPDGNVWMLQEVTTRLPGRIDTGATAFGSASDLESAMRRASAAHGEHE